MKSVVLPKRSALSLIASTATAAVWALYPVQSVKAAAPVFDNLGPLLGTGSGYTVPADAALAFTVPNPNHTPPDSIYTQTAVSSAYNLAPGTTSITGLDLDFCNATASSAFNGSDFTTTNTGLTNPANYTFPQYNGGTGTNFTGLKITISIWGSVTPATFNSTSGTYSGINASNPAYSNLLSQQVISFADVGGATPGNDTPPSPYTYFFSGYPNNDGVFPGLHITPVDVTGLSKIGITYDIQGSVDGGTTYQHYAGLEPIIGLDWPEVAGSTVYNAWYSNRNGETDGNFTGNLHYFTSGGVAYNQQAVEGRVFGVSPGVIYTWAAAADGSYSDSTQWNPAGVPKGNDTAVFNLGSTSGYSVEVADTETNQDMIVQNDTVNFNLDAQASDFIVQGTLAVGQPAVTGGSAVGTLNIVNTTGVALGLFEANAVVVGSNGGTGTISVTNGAILYGDNDIKINAGSKLVVGAFAELNTGTLTFAGTSNAWAGQLDIGNNGIVLRNASIGTVINELKTGLNNGKWNGQGIISSTAAADSTHLTAIGVITNNDGSGNKLYGSGATLGLFLGDDIDGNDPDLNSTLLRYTFFGDTNLDGKVDGTDYSRIDSGFVTHATGWYNGDFNYDGVVNGADYTLIDNAYNRQDEVSLSGDVASLTAGGLNVGLQSSGSGIHLSDVAYSANGSIDNAANPSASLTAQVAAVPEPTTLGLLALGAGGILGRRNRRRTMNV